MTQVEEDIEGPDEDFIAKQIKCYLEVYPVLSPTMLQSALGPQLSPKIWKPVLEDMITNGIITRDTVGVQMPSGRHRDFVTLALKK